MDGSKALRVQWLLEHSSKKPEDTDAVKYILHVFNFNIEGSLFYTLEHVKSMLFADVPFSYMLFLCFLV